MKRKRSKNTPTQVSFYCMHTRVNNPNIKRADRYCLRGIDMDPRWQKFDNFISDMGERPHGTTLDRIDNDKGYWPNNCRWATRKEQATNTSYNVWVTVAGRPLTISDAVAAVGYNHSTYTKMIRQNPGLEPQSAINILIQRKNTPKHIQSESACANGHPWLEGEYISKGDYKACRVCQRTANRKSYKARMDRIKGNNFPTLSHAPAYDEPLRGDLTDDVDPDSREEVA